MKNSFGEIGLYPNPNDGEMVNLNMTGLNEDELEFRIYDAMGKLIQEYQFIVDGSLNTVLVFSEKLTSGCYTIEFRSGDQIKTQRMVVQN
jgi:5-hydroxyisourate hydrolase-like protein (transthyretin family)